MEALLVAIQLALGIVVPWQIVRRDLLRLPADRLGRAWTPASMWMALVVFGPLCLPFHYAKTRRSLVGLLLGVAWMIASLLVIALVGTGLALALGVE